MLCGCPETRYSVSFLFLFIAGFCFESLCATSRFQLFSSPQRQVKCQLSQFSDYPLTSPRFTWFHSSFNSSLFRVFSMSIPRKTQKRNVNIRIRRILPFQNTKWLIFKTFHFQRKKTNCWLSDQLTFKLTTFVLHPLQKLIEYLEKVTAREDSEVLTWKTDNTRHFETKQNCLERSTDSNNQTSSAVTGVMKPFQQEEWEVKKIWRLECSGLLKI